MRKKVQPLVLPLVAFALPVFLYLAVMLAARITPFGDHTLLLWDANDTYSATLTYWRDVLLGQQSYPYTFSGMLGIDMIEAFATGLGSPLNGLLVLFPRDAMPLAFSLLTLLKIGLCGLTFLLYLQSRYQSGWIGVLFSTTYALMGFVAVYFLHTIWLEALILLPLTMLGVCRIAEGGRPFLFIVSFTCTICCQFYLAYMIGLFSAVFYIYLLLCDGTEKLTAQSRLRSTLIFACAAMLSVALAAAVLLPTVLHAFSLGNQMESSALIGMKPASTIFGILTKAYTAAISTVQERSGPPNYYVGVPMLAFAMMYFMNRHISKRQRLVSLGLVSIFMLSFLLPIPYLIWHLFNQPNFYPHRFSFLFSFVLLQLSWIGYQKLTELSAHEIRVRAVFLLCGFIGVTILLFHDMRYIEYLSWKTIVLDVVVFSASCFLLPWLGRQRRRNTAVAIIVSMQMICLMLNAYYPIVRLSTQWTVTRSAYQNAVVQGNELVNRIQGDDNGLYRMEMNFHRTDMDSLSYHYSGLTFFSTVKNESLIALCEQVGLYNGSYHFRYAAGTTPVLESLLGVKYILRKDGVSLEPLPDGYTELWTDGNVTAYENTYALPLAYLVPVQTLELTAESPFVNQNLLLSDLTETDAAVFTPVYDMQRTYDGKWETYTFSVAANRQLYMKSYGSAYTLNGDAVSAARMNGTVLLPPSGEDTAYTVQMTAPLNMYLAYFDLEAFKKAQAVLLKHGAIVTSDADSHLVITANVTDECTQLLITVPYDRGWHVWVDGEKAETTGRYGALLAVNLSQGEHTVELRFTPRGLWAGVSISAASLAVLAMWMILRKRSSLRSQLQAL